MLRQKNISGVRSNKMIRRLLALIIAVAFILLALLAGELIIKRYNNHKAIETKAINGTMADARRIGMYARMIEDVALDIESLLATSPADTLDTKGLIELVFRHQVTNPWHCTITMQLNEQGNAFKAQLQRPDVRKSLDCLHIHIVEAPSVHLQQADSGEPKPLNGWQPARWSHEEHAEMVAFQKVLRSKGPAGVDIPIGLLSIRMNLSQLNQVLNHRDMGSYGYRFLLQPDGLTINHPNKELLLTPFNFLEHASNFYSFVNQNKIQQAFSEHEPVTVVAENILSNQSSLIRLEPVPETGWFTGITLVRQELAIPDSHLKRHYFNVLTATIVLLLLSGAYFFMYTMKRSDIAMLKDFAWFSSAVFLIGLVSLWLLQINKGHESPYADQCITTMPQIEQYMKAQTESACDNEQPRPQFIQVGALIRSARLSESLETVDLYGIIWERIPKGIDIDINSGVRFPDEIESTLQEEYRIDEGSSTIIGWSFKTKIRQNFKTSIYPFDQLNIRLRIRPPHDFSSIIFVPDIESYKIISPSSCTLVADNFHIPGWRINSTYYNLHENSYNIDYGLRATNADRHIKDVLLNMTFNRDWVGSFVAVLIPIFVILGILYSSIHMITNDAETRKLFNFDGMRTSVIGSTFTLFLVFAIQNLRGKLIPDEILYVEKIYFIIYFAILANIAVSIAITEQRNCVFIRYCHGLFFRYIYWPFYLGVLYVLSLFSFYFIS
ncbi:hypothetical protein [Pelodictyon luteolum]|uniref:Cache domain-containing protein n=1 Tax=Chlorobium luteolum (strain DSM 273 / BCRC 81028 / 2530) TaxID=319225 RepID=Q3B4K0_CHLL3|nr:hypothetical protein [Pelodictyon luteolum]ABB23731.1 hypothetical protein Plut_0866 [Pelodictyon luteolum DSM 273]